MKCGRWAPAFFSTDKGARISYLPLVCGDTILISIEANNIRYTQVITKQNAENNGPVRNE
jgi:hypothetical protein